MNNLMQPLKLQFASSYKAYILNLFVIILGCILAYFVGDNSITSYSYILGFEYLFTIAIGIYSFSIIGKTYYDLKHDRRLFIISSIIINLINSIFMLILYFVVILLTNNKVIPINLFNYLLSFVLTYSLANTYGLYAKDVKYINIICVIITLLLFILLGHIAREILINITNAFILPEQSLKYIIKADLAIVINLVLIIIFNIFNTLKYNKTI